MRHIAVYLRVSTRRQDTRSQEPDLQRWVEAFADGTPVVWYSDKASGKTMDRPGWNRLEADIEAGRVTTVVVWRLDRLGRTASGLTALFERLQFLKINLVSLKDGVDLSTPAGRLIANVLASVAAYENEVRSERIVAGQQAARSEGKRWGGSQKGRRIKVTTEQVEMVKRLKQEATSVAAIARATGLSRPTVYSVLAEDA
jgi:DNA invertase Pin-like site-specific DNA recombinase